MAEYPTNLLITGASGFIGKHLLAELKHSHRIFAVARGPADLVGVPSHPHIEWLQADISDKGDATALLQRLQIPRGIDYVIHLAAYYDFTGKDAPEYQRTNVEGMRNVLEISRELNPRRFIFSSSVAACDFTKPGQVIHEKTPPNGQNWYARSKRLGERMLDEYRDSFHFIIVRFAALFSDWCEYEPLYYFLSKWLSPGWRNRILAGSGESAIPYLHIREAVPILKKLLAMEKQFENGEIFTISPDGATSHRDLFAAATACHFGNRRRSILMPKLACRIGLRGLDILGSFTGRRSFERPWMGRCIDKELYVDASRTRARLKWTLTPRFEIIRRMPFLIQNYKTYPDEWLKRNHVAARRTRLRINLKIQTQLALHEDLICTQFSKFLLDPINRNKFSAYLDCTDTQLEERHHLILRQLMCAIRTGDKGVFMNCCRHLAERWLEHGLPLMELQEALKVLCNICESILSDSEIAIAHRQAIYDHITMTFQFAVDAVQEVHESFNASKLHG